MQDICCCSIKVSSLGYQLQAPQTAGVCRMFLLVLYFTHLISDDPTTDHWFRNSPPAASCLSRLSSLCGGHVF